MNRKEFSDLLVVARRASGCGMNEISRRTGMTFQQIQRIETACNNYNLANAIKYIRKIGASLLLTHQEYELSTQEYQYIPEFIRKTRELEKLSQAKLSEAIKCSKTNLYNIEKQNSILHIDMFLVIAFVLNIKIEIR